MKTTHQKHSVVFIIIFLITLSFSGCKNSTQKTGDNINADEIKGNISISGAFALYPLTVTWAEEFKKLHPHVNIDISAGGAGKGMADVLSGMVDLAMFSREVSEEETAKGAWKLAVAKDAVFPTINTENPALKEILAKGLTKSQFLQLFTADKQMVWSDFEGITSQNKINVYIRSDACGAAAMWASYFNREQENLKGIGVYGDPGIADAVKKDKFGVGFNNLIYIYNLKTNQVSQGLEVIPIDLNENRIIDAEENFYGTMDGVVAAIQDGRYPAPPARDLYLISKGIPENEVIISFLRYILTEGQQMITKAGYVKLDSTTIQNSRLTLGIIETE